MKSMYIMFVGHRRMEKKKGFLGKIRKWKNVKFTKREIAELDFYKTENSGPNTRWTSLANV